jgi:hypothetical protein
MNGRQTCTCATNSQQSERICSLHSAEIIPHNTECTHFIYVHWVEGSEIACVLLLDELRDQQVDVRRIPNTYIINAVSHTVYNAGL